LGKNFRKPQGGIFFDSHCTSTVILAPPPMYTYRQPCRAISPHCYSFVVYDVCCHVTCTNDCHRSLVVSLVHSRLDYGNFVFVGLPAYLQRRLQTVLNAAACLVFRLRSYEHVSDALAILHWLRLPERVNFKLVLMAYPVPSVERYGATVSESTRSGIKPARSWPSAVVVHAAAVSPAVPSVNSRLSLVSCRSLHFLEHSARRRAVCTVCLFLPETATFLFHQSFPDIIV